MKKVLALVLALAMVTMTLTACGGDEPVTTDPVQSSDPAESTDPVESEEPAIDISEPVTLKWYLHGSNVKDDSDVMAEVNAYLGEKLNVTLEPIWGTWGDFDDNSVLSLTTGADVDIYFTCSWSKDEYNKYAREGYWKRLDDPDNNLIEKYASEFWSQLPEVLTVGATVMGKDGKGVYAVPGLKDFATQNCWDVNVTLLEKYGYTLADIEGKTYYDFGDIFATVKAGEGKDFYPLLIEGAVLERMVTNSIIVTGDNGNVNLLSYYLNPDDVSAEGAYGNTILNKFGTDEFKAFAEKTREYAQAGYIDPAMGNTNQANEARTNAQLAGKYLIGTQSYALGYEVQASAERHIEVAMIPTTDAYTDTTASQGAMMAIANSSANPERALMFLNLLNTDAKLMTLLNYGIEGVHYNLEDGLLVFTEARDNYMPWTNGMGNIGLLPVQKEVSDNPNYYDEVFYAYYNQAKKIPVLGYAFNSEEVETESTALANVAAQYMLPLCTGQVDPATELPKFNDALKAAGMEKYVEAAQTQLDEFLSSK